MQVFLAQAALFFAYLRKDVCW